MDHASLALPGNILHLHIPKTGGTSVRHLLQAAFGAWHVHPERFAAYSLWPAEVTRSFRIYSSHVGLDQRALFPDPLTIVTGLRDPICRFLSFYRHARSLADDSNVFSFMFNRHPLAELLSERFEPFLRHTGNTATQYLSGISVGDDLSWTKDARVIDQATANLAAIEHLYLFEAFPQTIGGILDELGGTAAAGPLPFDNVGTRDPALFEQLGQNDVTRLRHLLHADYQLYDVAYQRFRSTYPLGSEHDLSATAQAELRQIGKAHVIMNHPGGDGCIAFGPYLDLPHGQYRVRFSVPFVEVLAGHQSSALRLEVTRDCGRVLLADTTIDLAFGGPVRHEVDLDFSLATPQIAVEFRAIVQSGCHIALRQDVRLLRLAY